MADEKPWKHPDVLSSAPSPVLALRGEALAHLERNQLLTPEAARAGQVRARELGDDYALALWSRLRVRALRGVGRPLVGPDLS